MHIYYLTNPKLPTGKLLNLFSGAKTNTPTISWEVYC